MSVNEPVVSSSPMSQQNKKRSISTSLVDFFNKIKNSNNNTYSLQKHNNYSNKNNNGDDNVNQDLPSRKKKKLGYPEASSLRNNSNNNGVYQNEYNNNNNIQEPLILYANEDEDGSMEVVRPPILPILPVQRLKLLKQKQMLRLQNDSRLINQNLNNSNNNINNINMSKPLLLQNIEMSSESASPNHEYDQSVIIHKSGTPSPVKNPSGINELILDSNNNIINKKPDLPLRKNNNRNNDKTIQLRSLRTTKKPNKIIHKGTKWSGNFEYDLSEYDTKPKQSITQNTNVVNNNNMVGIANIVNTDVSPKIPISKSNKLVESNQNKKLSKTKMDLLINGFDSDKSSTSTKILPTTVVPAIKDDKILKLDSKTNESSKSDKKPNVILPTMGFDFIKDNETPSKQVSFTFGNKDKSTITESKEKASKPLSFSIDSKKPKESGSAPKLSFSFGTGSKSKTEEEEEEPTRKKLVAPAVTIDMTKDVNKPTFSFGSIKPAEDTTITADKKAPAFSFGVKPPTTEKVPSDKPPFSFGGIGSKPNDKTTDETVKKPTFSFGASTTTSTAEKNDANDEEEPRRKKPAFSFGKTSSATTTTEPSTESKPSFSFGLTGAQDKKEEEKKTPSFSFGLTKPPVATEEKKTPSFSFGTGASTKTAPEEPAAKKPALFSFDKKPSTEQQATAVEKPTFSFGTKPATASATASADTASNPLFSLNKSTEADKEKSTTPSFSFGAAPSIITANTTEGKPANPLLSKPSFTFGSTISKENTPSPATTSAPSFSFNKPATGNSTTQLNQDAKSLGVSLNNPLVSKPSGFGASANNTSAPKLFSGAPPAVGNPSAPSTGGFSFSRQQTPGLAGASVTPGASLFGGVNSNNTTSNGNNNSAGGFNFGLSSGSTTPAVNPLLSNNNGMQPGGSVFSGGIAPNNILGGAGNNQPMANGNFNFGQPQPQQPPQIPSFNPSSQVNIQFNQNATANPMDIFGASSNNNSNTNLNNNLTPQPSQFQTRKIARMRGSRR